MVLKRTSPSYPSPPLYPFNSWYRSVSSFIIILKICCFYTNIPPPLHSLKHTLLSMWLPSLKGEFVKMKEGLQLDSDIARYYFNFSWIFPKKYIIINFPVPIPYYTPTYWFPILSSFPTPSYFSLPIFSFAFFLLFLCIPPSTPLSLLSANMFTLIIIFTQHIRSF